MPALAADDPDYLRPTGKAGRARFQRLVDPVAGLADRVRVAALLGHLDFQRVEVVVLAHRPNCRGYTTVQPLAPAQRTQVEVGVAHSNGRERIAIDDDRCLGACGLFGGDGDWCKLSVGKRAGWIAQGGVFGIGAQEQLD